MSQLQEASPRAGASGVTGAAPSGDFYTHQIASSIRNSQAQDGTLKITAGTPTSRKTFTYSWWWKRYNTSTATQSTNIFTAGTGGGTYVFWTFTNSSLMQANFNFTGGSFGDSRLTTNMQFRDLSAWYHCVLRFDSTQATASNRVRLYVNGVEPTYSSASVQTDIAQNEDISFMNQSGVEQGWGGLSGKGTGQEGCDVQMAEIVFNDGQSYGPDSYGETKNGVWIPKDPSGLTFGNNGYWLKMASGAIGTDSSGNGNNFTVANIAAHDVMLDTPTFNSSSNGGNFATFNPLDDTENNGAGGCDFAEGNLQAGGAGDNVGIASTIATPSTGKYYAEFYLSATPNNAYVGYYPSNESAIMAKVWVPSGNRTWINSNLASYAQNGTLYKDGNTSTSSWGSTFTTGDIIQIAIDADNDAVYFGKNNTWQNSGDPESGASKTGAARTSIPKNVFPAVGHANGSGTVTWKANFGADGTFSGSTTAGGNADANGYGNFKYAPPSGYLALCTANLPTDTLISPAETDDNYPQKLFNTIIYSGDGGGSQTTGFQPDWVWVKRRDGDQSHGLWDSSRGTTKVLNSDATNAEGTSSGLTAFNTDGYTMGLYYNQSGNTYVSWSWRANGGTTSSNSNGSITSTVQVDPSGCFSIGTYTGNATNSTIGHGLSKKPDFIIIKSRSQIKNWMVWSSGLGNDTRGYIQLNTTGGSGDDSLWNNTAPTSSVFSVNYGTTEVNAPSGETYLFYAFANCEGYIKAGSYVGNGSTDGAFIYTGFKPKYIMLKRFNRSGDYWYIIDPVRNPYNGPGSLLLNPDRAVGESGNATTDVIDILSNGFKMRTSGGGLNGSGGEWLYLAMSENPFQFATAR